MSYSTYLRKPKEKDFSKFHILNLFIRGKPESKSNTSFNSDLLGLDLFCHVTYMASIATSNLPRNILFEYASKLPYNSVKYFKEITFMAKKLNYDYSEACRIVGEKTKEEEPKAFLLRFSSALASGETEADFLAREAQVLAEKYGDDYERRIESLKKWTDAFIALTMSASLVVVISVVSMLIFPTSPAFIALLTWFMLMATGLGAWIMYRATPKEIKTHSLPNTSRLQRLAKFLFRYALIPVCTIFLSIALIMKADIGLIMLIAGICILPVGLIAYLDDRHIDKIDSDLPAFLRSLGGIAKAIGTTITEALDRLDLGSIGSLKPNVQKLIKSLKIGIEPSLCWKKFVEETGSEQVNRSVRIFWDGISLGGDSKEVGNQASMFALKIALLREKRKMITSGFFYLGISMHATLSILLIGIYQVLLNFSAAVQKMAGEAKTGMEALTQLPTFGFFTESGQQLQTLNLMVTSMVIMLTIVNALTIKFVDGGNNLKFLFYLGLTLLITSLSFMVVPELIKGIFGTIGIIE